jgi:hypothetical protein
MPEWYEVIQAARYLGVEPWELAVQPVAWLEMALTAQAAEAKAQAKQRKRETL